MSPCRRWQMTSPASLSIRVALSLSLFPAAIAAAGEPDRSYVMNAESERPKPIVAVDNVCAWPNLTVLRDGTIVATIHNQPCHLKLPADVDCWASEDGGRTWAKRGTPAPRDNARVARGNVAAGLARNGDLVVVASGWADPRAEDRGGHSASAGWPFGRWRAHVVDRRRGLPRGMAGRGPEDRCIGRLPGSVR